MALGIDVRVLNDEHFRSEDIRAKLHLFLSCIVIDECHRSPGPAR